MTVVQFARTSFFSCVIADNHKVPATVVKTALRETLIGYAYSECPCVIKCCITELVDDKGVEKVLH